MDRKIVIAMDFLVVLFFIAIDYQFVTTPHTCNIISVNGNIIKQTVCRLPFSKKWVWCDTNSIGNAIKDIKCSNTLAPNPLNNSPVNFTLPESVYLP